jgi:hypothetical protein
MQTAIDLLVVTVLAVSGLFMPQVATVLLLALIYLRLTEIARRPRV